MAKDNVLTMTDNQRTMLMELAIEKAQQLSPYAGVAGVIVDSEGRLLATAVAYAGVGATLIEELLERLQPGQPAALYLTEEPAAASGALEPQVQRLAAAGIREICIGIEAGGGGQGLAALARQHGLVVHVGIAEVKLRHQHAIAERFRAEGMPWVCGLLALDESGAALRLGTFREQFGFQTQFRQVSGRFPLFIYDSAHPLVTLEQGAQVEGQRWVGLGLSTVAAADLVPAVLGLCRQHAARAVLVSLDPAQLAQTSVAATVSELVIYQANTRQTDIDVVVPELALVRNGNWELLDRSPIGDGVYFRYRKAQA